MEKRVIHFSGLNGLRAIAALSVVFSHTTLALNSFGLNSFIFGKSSDGNPKTTLLAGFGVSIFFALSGFLITYLLLEEKKIKGINIKNFYVRRALRIFPLYYLYFILVLLTLFLFNLQFEKQSVAFYVFFAANIPFIFGGIIDLLGHYWSLGVEEQFYAFYPWYCKKVSSILKTTVILCATLILLKLFLYVISINYETAWLYSIVSVTRFQCMLIGAIGAILYFQKNNVLLKIVNNKVTQLISWFVILLIAINKFHIISLLDNEFVSLISTFLIIGQIEKSNRLINLDKSFFDFLGKISYGIYVIHPLVIFYLSKIIKFSVVDDTFLDYLVVYFAVFSATLTLSYLSYEFFEKKFLLLKVGYTTIKSSGTKVASV